MPRAGASVPAHTLRALEELKVVQNRPEWACFAILRHRIKRECTQLPQGASMIRTFQDFEKASDVAKFVSDAIATYKGSDVYKMALIADKYDAQRNETILETVPMLFNIAGTKVIDTTVSNNQIASNFFNRLNTQRCMYSLGNGVSFIDPYEAVNNQADDTKRLLGPHFDHDIAEAGYYALIHGMSYLFWNMDRCHVFKATEFVPLDDEHDGTLKAGIRFWQLDTNKPLNAVLYERDGYTTFRRGNNGMVEAKKKTAYKITYQYTDAEDEAVVIDEENYPDIPIVRMFGSRLRQSTLVGMREAIDAYDLVKSGFANDMTDCAQIYWIVENYGGMNDDDLKKFLDRLKFNHIANADTQSGGRITPYTQEIPYSARQALLKEIRDGIYEDFGGLDVHTIAAGATNDHIDAAYQPLDENAADFEHWVSDAIIRLLALQGIDDTPIFQRNRISNKREQVDMIVQEASWLDQGTILRKLPNITPEEANAIMSANKNENMERMGISVGGAQGEGE